MTIAFLAAAVALILFGAGCKKTSEPSSRAPKKLTLAVIPMGTTHEFWKAIHAGALTAARELGVEIIWKGPLKEDDRNEQIQIVETLTNAGVDAIVLTPMDDRALVRAGGRGEADGNPDGHLQFRARRGPSRRLYLDRQLQGRRARGGIHRLAAAWKGQRDPHPGDRQRRGQHEAGGGIPPDHPDEIPRRSESSRTTNTRGVTTETAYQTTENLLNRYADVQAIFTPNESSTFGCLRALEDHGLAGKVIHVGFDSSKKLIEALEKKSSGVSSSRTRSAWAIEASGRPSPISGRALRKIHRYRRLPGHAGQYERAGDPPLALARPVDPRSMKPRGGRKHLNAHSWILTDSA